MLFRSRSLARGSTPSCRCFGQLSAAPIGTETLVRNFILLALAGLLVWQGWWRPIPPLFGWFEGLSAAQQIVVVGVCGLVVVLAVMAALAVQLLAQQGRLLLRIEALEQQLAMRDDPLLGHMEIPGLPIGSDAPRFDLPEIGRAHV